MGIRRFQVFKWLKVFCEIQKGLVSLVSSLYRSGWILKMTRCLSSLKARLFDGWIGSFGRVPFMFPSFSIFWMICWTDLYRLAASEEEFNTSLKECWFHISLTTAALSGSMLSGSIFNTLLINTSPWFVSLLFCLNNFRQYFQF